MMQTSFIYDCTPHFMYFAYKFTGKERDAESGLDYFGARYYASNMGRWMSPRSSRGLILYLFLCRYNGMQLKHTNTQNVGCSRR